MYKYSRISNDDCHAYWDITFAGDAGNIKELFFSRECWIMIQRSFNLNVHFKLPLLNLLYNMSYY